LTKVLIKLLINGYLQDFDEVASVLRTFVKTELDLDLLIAINEHELGLKFQDDIMFVNRLREFYELFDDDGLPNVSFSELKEVYLRNPDYPKKLIKLPSDFDERVSVVNAIDKADIWSHIYIDYLDDFQSFVSSLIAIQTKNTTILSDVVNDYMSRRLHCKHDCPLRDYLLLTKPDWKLTKTFDLFLSRWTPNKKQPNLFKFYCELKTLVFDLQLKRDVTLFDSNPDLKENDEFIYELKKRLIFKEVEQKRLEERFGLKLFNSK